MLARHIDANRVDAGFEWDGYHATTVGAPPPAIILPDAGWYGPLFGVRPCVVVTNTPGSDGTPLIRWKDALGAVHTLFARKVHVFPDC
jgi:hypothetical protein